jgi:uridine kinase
MRNLGYDLTGDGMDIIAYVVDKIYKAKQGAPLIVAFDGVDTSGKTFLADRVAEKFDKLGDYQAIRVSIDKFHNPKEIRLQRGDLSPEGFFLDSFNYGVIIENVIMPAKNGKDYIIPGVYDYKIESDINIKPVSIASDTVILFDGIFMNRDELFQYWDMSIFLDVSFDTVRKRALERDLEYFGSVENVLKRYNNRYIPGQRLYLDRCNPKERADIVFDNNDFNNPVLIRG